MKQFRKCIWLFSLLAIAALVLSGCGDSTSENEGELTAVNEQGEEVSLLNKERATILFHFTEVG
ncbi:hypothetical protein [Halalkalibacter krulwichiae]|uniref:Uncharacterized protein n=1 Tax=Halalkalibacter krulwichiae TaxID=199441 RepID=A0A1X9MDJ0_9BACI|nr:hypothetical protein [Halalkalibacter krulwichiae]ARK31509.1 hypothetical protein BkAM31D_17610 [Halalkalibacter krulwichiae]